LETVRAKSTLLRAAGGPFGILLVAVVALLTSAPLLVATTGGDVALNLLAGTVLVASLHAARPGGKAVAFGLAMALADFGVGRLVALHGVGNLSWVLLLQVLLWLAILIFTTATILEAIFASRSVSLQTLQASLCVYLLLGLIWAFLLAAVQLTAPGSFESQHGAAVAWSDELSRRAAMMRLIVFSYSTLTGTGYADLTPTTDFARMAGSLEAMTAQIYLAVVIARLVGIQAAPPPEPRAAATDDSRSTDSVERRL
jgi:hypothetical protein